MAPWTLLALAALGSVGTAVGSALIIAAPRGERALPYLVSFAAGALLGGAALVLLPEALALEPGGAVPLALLAGLLAFFLLEILLVWRHAHHPTPGHAVDRRAPRLAPTPAYLVLAGDGVHNLMDGVALGAAYAADPALGIATALAVAAHEIPQELGDVSILLAAGFAPARAFGLNVGMALLTIPGAALAYHAFPLIADWVGIALAVTAGGFLYIALADLVPHLHHGRGPGRARAVEVALVLLGVSAIAIVDALAH